MTRTQRNTFAVIAIIGGVALVAVFFATLFGSSHGEVAGALGGIIGGAIGAGGAGYSVYYSIERQRDDEIEKTSRAVLAEVAVFSKYFVGHLNLCEMIQQGLKLPKAQLPTALLTPDPIIYQSVADKISLLPRPTQVVNFYTRLKEMDGIAVLIVNSPSQGSDITPDDIRGLADLLITQCQVAQAILSNVEPDPKSEETLASGLRSQMLAALDQQLIQAKRVFPDAESFR